MARAPVWLPFVCVAAALALLTAFMPALAPLIHRAFPEVEPPVYGFASFASLLLSHAEIVAAACLASIAAVLAVAVPVLGYGDLPTFLALAIYGFLPIVANVVAGIEGVPASVREAA